MIRIRITLAAAALAALGLSRAALGQYVWLDERGIRQYSDMPPPASVPNSRILKQPSGSPAVQAPPRDDSPSAVAAPAASQSRPPMSIAEKNADFQKRRTEQAEKEKKAAEEAKRVAEKEKYCDRSRDYQRTLESGQRIATTERNGERSFMTDEQRASELADVKRALQDCK